MTGWSKMRTTAIWGSFSTLSTYSPLLPTPAIVERILLFSFLLTESLIVPFLSAYFLSPDASLSEIPALWNSVSLKVSRPSSARPIPLWHLSTPSSRSTRSHTSV